MVQYAESLERSLAALADVTRRGVLEELGRGESSITDLAEKFDMTLTGVSKHVGVLERAGLVVTEKVGRVRRCRIGANRLEEVATWVEGTAASGRRGSTSWKRSSRNCNGRSRRMDPRDDRSAEEVSIVRRTTVERRSDRDLVVTRTFDAPARLVFDAWSRGTSSSGGGYRSLWAWPCAPVRWT
ncbi:MAG: metalloregulator ArsR/SmtB family transcription factor [Microthrixaceae bacterium]